MKNPILKKFMEEYKGIIYMKIGYHTNEEIDEIVKRKLKEERDVGYFFWGYGGSFCHPLNQIKPFIEKCLAIGIKPKLLMSFTPSKYISTPNFAKEYSTDKKDWRPLPEKVSIKGSKYAIVCKNLKKVNVEIDLNSYMVGVGNKKGTPLGEYIRYRVDKACAFLNDSKKKLPEKTVKIVYVADIINPWAVFVR